MNSENCIKLSFLGDVTCDRPLLNASKNKSDAYDFSPVFSEVKSIFRSSDYVIANFENVCAGSSNDYKNEYLLYNCPDKFVKDMKSSGIDFVTTANNHCLDQGIEGLKRTIRVLDSNSVEHTGTYTDQKSRDACKIVLINDIKIAILSYTYGTNESNTGVILNQDTDYYVGLLREQKDAAKDSKKICKKVARYLKASQRRKISRLINRTKLRLGISYFKPYTDKIQDQDTANRYLDQIEKDIIKAKSHSDVVVACLHIGGQFNEEPGEYSKFIVDFFVKKGVDIIVGNHPHVIQKAYNIDSAVVAYSLGGFNLSISADYIVHEPLPEYSLILNVYIDEASRRYHKVTFSILKIVEDDSHMCIVYPVDKLVNELSDHEILKLNDDITKIYNRVTGKNLSKIKIQNEYELNCENS